MKGSLFLTKSIFGISIEVEGPEKPKLTFVFKLRDCFKSDFSVAFDTAQKILHF